MSDSRSKRKHLLLPIYLLILILLFETACKRKELSDSGAECNNVESAQMFDISKAGDVTIVEIYGNVGKSLRQRLLLIPDGKDIPSGLPEGVILRTPLKNIVIFSDIYAGALEELGKPEIVKGVVDSKYYSSEYIKNGLTAGRIVDVGNSSAPSAEKIIALQPQAILMTAFEGMNTKGLDKLNIPIIYLCDNLEHNPLGRAEWIKVIGLLCGKETASDSIFRIVAKTYDKVKRESRQNITGSPKVLTEMMYQGVWYVPGGGSYQAALLKDAGAYYPWEDKKSGGSLSLSFEEVISRGRDADFWLIRSFNPPGSVADMLADDSRYKNFAALQKGLYICDTSVTDIFRATAFHPEVLLEEYAMIFSGKTDSLKFFKNIR